MMTLLELQDLLGKQTRAVYEAEGGTRQFAQTMERAEYMAKMAKQMNNTADNILRGSKMCNRTEEVSKLIVGDSHDK